MAADFGTDVARHAHYIHSDITMEGDHGEDTVDVSFVYMLWAEQ